MGVIEEIAREVLAAIDGGPPVVTATVVAVAGVDGPPLGAKMLVRADGSTLGTLGGGPIEQAVLAAAAGAIPRHAIETVRFSAAGEVVGDRHTESAVDVLIEVVEPPARLIIVGGGHIGRALCSVGALAGFTVTVIDDRPEYASRERFPEADAVICRDFEAALADLRMDTTAYVVLVTRGHKQDELSLRALVRRPWAYLGMIGSKRRTGAVLEHLAEDGVPRAVLDRVHTPIGLDIGAETPEEIAVSIIAEVIMVRRGGSGRQMYYRRGSAARA